DDDLPGQDLDVAEVVEADEGVASEVFAHFDRFEQETGSVLLELEEGGDRRLEIRGDLAHGGLQFQLDRGHSASVRLGATKKPAGSGAGSRESPEEGSLQTRVSGASTQNIGPRSSS